MKDEQKGGWPASSCYTKVACKDDISGGGNKGFCDAPDASGGWLLEYFHQRVSARIEPARGG